MPTDLQQIIPLINSLVSVAFGVLIKIAWDKWKERPEWRSLAIQSSFERKAEGDGVSINLKFTLVNQGRKVSIPFAMLNVITDPRFPDLGDTILPKGFQPIILPPDDSKDVMLTFDYNKALNLKDIKEVERRKLIDHGINAEIELVDNHKNSATAPLFIYEGGQYEFLKRLGCLHPLEYKLIYDRGVRSYLVVRKNRGQEILKLRTPQSITEG